MKQPYLISISNSYHSEYKKTLYWVLEPAPWNGAGMANVRKKNPKTRTVVLKRLRKLNRYLKIAWNGYRQGKHPKSLRSDPE